MYIPGAQGKIIVRVVTKGRQRKAEDQPRSQNTEEGSSRMSHSPSDEAAGWTFVSAEPEANEEASNGTMNIKEEGAPEVQDTSFDEDKSSGKKEVEELDDVATVSSETDSLPSSDVDVLEESVGPDHDILHISSVSPASSFSISSPLEGTSQLCLTVSNSPTELTPQSVQMDAEVSASVQNDSKEPLPPVSVKSAESNAQPAKMAPTPCNLSHAEKSKKYVVETQNDKDQHGNEIDISREEFLENFPKFTLLIRRKVLATYLLIWSALVLFVYFVIAPKIISDRQLLVSTGISLNEVQDETLKCLGLQHLTAVENNHYGMLLTNVCIDDSPSWKSKFEELLKDKVLKNVIYEVSNETCAKRKTEIIEEFMFASNNNVEKIKFDLLLRQLEYLELLPAQADGHVNAEHSDKQADAVSHVLDKKLEEQEQLLSHLHQFVDELKMGNFALKSLHDEVKILDGNEGSNEPMARLKSKIHRLELENTFLCNQLQHMLDQFESGGFLNPDYWLGLSSNLNNNPNTFGSDRLEELMGKVDSLLSSNNELKAMYSQISDTKQGSDKKESPDAPEGTTPEHPGLSEKVLKSLVRELVELQKTLVDELIEVKRAAQMREGVTGGSESSQGEKSTHWSWSSFQHAFNEMFDGTHLDLAEKLKYVRNFHRLLHNERRPFVKDMFQSIKNFWKKTVTKGKEFIESTLHEMNPDSSLSGMFGSVVENEPPKSTAVPNVDAPEKLMDQWPNGFQDGLSSAKNEKIEPDDVSNLSELNDPCHEQSDFEKYKANWLFERAADRESLRQVYKTNLVNWYLRRGQHMWRSPVTQEQQELLQKMEASLYPPPAKQYSKDGKESNDGKV